MAIRKDAEVAGQSVDTFDATAVEEGLAKSAAILQVILLADGVPKHVSNAVWAAADILSSAQSAFYREARRVAAQHRSDLAVARNSAGLTGGVGA
ncbi:MAG: hypothetical protein JNJ74_04255 [Xanthomonadales bacterium]|nr:hypothetical protein [Xanthomonadales bacterium]